MLVHFGCEFVQRAELPRHAIVQVEPRPDGPFRMVDAAWDARADVSPDPDATDFTASEVSADAMPDSVLSYTLPSRFRPSDELGNLAWQLFGSVPSGWARVQAIVDWVHREIAFDYSRTTSTASALDVLAAHAGVCRDFARLAIALCRSFSIPARYAFGYLPDIGVGRVELESMLVWADPVGD